MSRVYLVRHATHGLVGKALAGRMPGVPLTPDGQAEARRLAGFFADRDVMAILSSPLDRCRQTAAPIAERLALPIAIEPGLNEIDCGDWTGKSFDKLAPDPRWQAWNRERSGAAIPGGDTMAAVQARVMAVLDLHADPHGEPVIMVSHSDVIKAAILAVLGAPLERHDRLEIDPASITTLDLWPGGGKVVRMNDAVPA